MWPLSLLRRNDEPLGRRGERLAAAQLRRSGLKILARNYRCPHGEADLVALAPPPPGLEGATIVFVEVKTRTSDAAVRPESAVNAAKQRKLRQVARYYLAARPEMNLSHRFDVVSIVLPPDGPPRIEHFENAF